jgi:hypothetical protein
MYNVDEMNVDISCIIAGITTGFMLMHRVAEYKSLFL